MVYIIGSQDSTGKLLGQVILLVGSPGGGEDRHTVRSVLLLDVTQTAGYQIQGLVPGSFPKLAIFFNKWCGEPVGRVNKIPAKATLYTQGSFIDRTFYQRPIRTYSDHLVIPNIQL